MVNFVKMISVTVGFNIYDVLQLSVIQEFGETFLKPSPVLGSCSVIYH